MQRTKYQEFYDACDEYEVLQDRYFEVLGEISRCFARGQNPPETLLDQADGLEVKLVDLDRTMAIAAETS